MSCFMEAIGQRYDLFSIIFGMPLHSDVIGILAERSHEGEQSLYDRDRRNSALLHGPAF